MFDKTDYTGKKWRLGWTEKGIIGMIFTPMGVLFLTLGILFHWLGVGEDPEDPVIFLAVFGGVGLSFLIVGAALLTADVQRRKAAMRAIESGRRVMGTVSGVQVRNNVRNNSNMRPYVVEVHWQDEAGVMHIFHSRYLYFNPEGIMTSDQVPVYLEEGGNGFFVDIDAVLPEIRMH